MIGWLSKILSGSLNLFSVLHFFPVRLLFSNHSNLCSNNYHSSRIWNHNQKGLHTRRGFWLSSESKLAPWGEAGREQELRSNCSLCERVLKWCFSSQACQHWHVISSHILCYLYLRSQNDPDSKQKGIMPYKINRTELMS